MECDQPAFAVFDEQDLFLFKLIVAYRYPSHVHNEN
jgi:hypothetical protein